jgi:hypothetical protein
MEERTPVFIYSMRTQLSVSQKGKQLVSFPCTNCIPHVMIRGNDDRET